MSDKKSTARQRIKQYLTALLTSAASASLVVTSGCVQPPKKTRTITAEQERQFELNLQKYNRHHLPYCDPPGPMNYKQKKMLESLEEQERNKEE